MSANVDQEICVLVLKYFRTCSIETYFRVCNFLLSLPCRVSLEVAAPDSMHITAFAVLAPSLCTRRLGRGFLGPSLGGLGIGYPQSRVDAALHVVPGFLLGYGGYHFLQHFQVA